ncbi:MAG TPA: helix-turn-helix domain-containing protein [Steroidobacteraceae bacterium]|nr:helix-turn-helix domain-containing protein [Steroidobacteraceae bacterium]
MSFDRTTSHGIETIDDPMAWHTRINESYFPIDFETPADTHFTGVLHGRKVNDLTLFRCSSGPIVYERAKRHILRQHRESYLVTVPEITTCIQEQNCRSEEYAPGTFFIERVHEPFIFHQPSANTLLTLAVDGTTLNEQIRRASLYCGIPFDARRGAGALFVEFVRAILAHVETLSAQEMTVVSRQILELLGMAIRDDERVLSSHASAVHAAHLMRIERYVATHLQDPSLTPQSLATACGLSTRYLHQVFAAAVGQTVCEYIRRRRLLAVQKLLTDRADLRLVEIAYRCGFPDQAALSRQFKRQFDMTPSEFRSATAQRAAESKAARFPDRPPKSIDPPPTS